MAALRSKVFPHVKGLLLSKRMLIIAFGLFCLCFFGQLDLENSYWAFGLVVIIFLSLLTQFVGYEKFTRIRLPIGSRERKLFSMFLVAQFVFFVSFLLTLHFIDAESIISDSTKNFLVGKSAFWETLQVVCLVLAVGFYLYFLMRNVSSSTPFSRLVKAGFCITLILIAGEETNWGQQWFHFATPQAVESRAIEGKMNLHELRMEGVSLEDCANYIVHLLLWTYGALFPLCVYSSGRIRALFDMLKIPVPHYTAIPLALLALNFENEWVYKTVAQTFYFPPPWDASELRETILYFLFLSGVIFSTLRWRCEHNRQEVTAP